jgi:hypothetical protein
VKHPLFSENMDDKLSRFLLIFSESKLCLLFGFSALFIFVIASQNSTFFEFLNKHWLGNILQVYCVAGAILTWLAAQAHSYKIGYRKLVLFMFFLWPLSFLYLMHVKVSSNLESKNT